MEMFDAIKKVHLIGIGGIGVSAVAKLLLRAGVEVSGSDAHDSGIVRELSQLGVRVHIGHAAENLPDGVDLVVRSGAVPDDNTEMVETKRRSVRNLTYFEFLGEYAAGKRVIAVAGTHGKSTTTAMLGLILIEAGFDPTVIVGSKVSAFPDGNLRLGGSDLLVVEACEHEAHLLVFNPFAAIVNNVEADHLDYYRDLNHIKRTFREFAGHVSPDGFLVVNADDSNGSAALTGGGRTVSFGFSENADYRIARLRIEDGTQKFSLSKNSSEEIDLKLHVPGRFNVSNAAAAAVMALELGAPASAIRKALAGYSGVWRRFEIVGKSRGATVISDYAHHPTAVAATLAAAREFYPGRKTVLVFQPHHRNRTRNLFDSFVASFDGADAVILPEIYDVAGRENEADRDVSSRDLAAAVRERDRSRGAVRTVRYAADLNEASDLLYSLIEPDSVVLIMGAGNVDQLARRSTQE